LSTAGCISFLVQFCQQAMGEFQELHDKMQQMLQQTPAIAVALVRDGAVVHSAAAGEASGVEADAEKTVFMTASISKLMNAVLCMQMVERGELELDQDINEYLGISVRNPNFPDAQITTRSLLTHTSGIRDDEYAVNLVGRWKVMGADCLTTLDTYVHERLLSDAARSIWSSLSPPGEASYHYSNAGATLVGWVIECASGRSLPHLAQERIFDVVGMPRSKYTLAEAQALPNSDLAMPHRGPGELVGHYGLGEFPAAGLRSTVMDLGRFLQEFTAAQNRLLSPDSLAEMFPADYQQGLAWWGQDATYGSQQRGIWEHGGCMEGVRTHIYLYPEQRAGIVVLTNAPCHYQTFARLATGVLFSRCDEECATRT